MNARTRNIMIVVVAVVVVAVIAVVVLGGNASLPGATVTINGCTIQAGAQCPGVNLTNANLKGTNLNGANLQNAIITGAQFDRADLRGANLKGASGWAGYSQTDVAKQCNTILPSGETKTVYKDC